MDEIRIKVEEDYMQGMKYKDICDKYDLSINTLKSWIKRYNWSEERKRRNKKGAPKKKRGAPLNNKNAVGNSGGAAPTGNINSIKHGAYQSIYADMLNTEDQILFNMVQPTTDIDEEIRLLRFKIARLLSNEVVFEDGVEKKISETVRINGINACMDQLRKLIETKTKTLGDTEKLQLEKEKFEFQKHKTDIDMDKEYKRVQIEKMKAQIEKIKGISDDIEDTSELRKLLEIDE